MNEQARSFGVALTSCATPDAGTPTFGTTPGDPALAEVQTKGGGEIPVPTLYLHGVDDGCLGIEGVVDDELRPFFPAGLEIERVPGAGHFLHLERPDVVNPRVLTFLSS